MEHNPSGAAGSGAPPLLRSAVRTVQMLMSSAGTDGIKESHPVNDPELGDVTENESDDGCEIAVEEISVHDITCPICHDVMCEPIKMPCSHIFDRLCIGTWVNSRDTCPLCKAYIPSQAVEADIVKYIVRAAKRLMTEDYARRRQELDIMAAEKRAREAKYESSTSRANAELCRFLRRDGAIQSEVVEDVMLEIPRHMFFPRTELLTEDEIYNTSPTRLSSLGFNVSAPSIHAHCLEAMRIQMGHKILDIGCGCGIMAMYAALISGPTGLVHGIDISGEAINLSRSNYEYLQEEYPALQECSIDFFQANCFNFLPPNGVKYDRIYAGACCPPGFEDDLLEMLAPGGVLVMPMGYELLRLTLSATRAVRRESLLPVRFSNLILPEEDDSLTYNGLNLHHFGRMGCGLHCKACGAKLFEPSDLMSTDQIRRIALADGDVYCLRDSVPGINVGEMYEYREISLGILSLLQVYSRKRACDLTCNSCDIYLGTRIMNTQIGFGRDFEYAEDDLISVNNHGKSYVCKAYVELCNTTGQSIRQTSDVICSNDNCGNVLTLAGQLLSDQHCWDLEEGNGIESAAYYNALRRGAFKEYNRHETRLAQGAMVVTDVQCSACGTTVGWRFLSSHTRFGEPRNQIGRFGLVHSRIRRIGGSSRLSIPTVDAQEMETA